MATVAGPGPLPSDSIQPGGGGGAFKVGAKVRRKTPSELRGEQLKRVNVAEFVDESSAPLHVSSNLMGNVKKSGVLKPPRYIDTRVNDIYPAKKSRFKGVSLKDSTKENCSIDQYLRSVPLLSNFAAQRKQLQGLESSTTACPEVLENVESLKHPTMEPCSFRNVTQISSAGGNSATLASIDMDKALKGLSAHCSSELPVGSCERSTGPSGIYPGDFFSQAIISGQKAPLDLTLKTIFRVVSQSPLNEISRVITSSSYDSLHTLQRSFSDDQRTSSNCGTATASSGFHSKALHSWVYPQSTLPASLISVLTASAAEKAEMDFLKKRQSAWEESFRGLYYMLRKNACNTFYVCASQFVVMFTGHDSGDKTSCNAYISRSTRGLRSLLREHDVCFTMPLCLSKVEQATTEDLVELSEIEKHNLGQTRMSSSLSDIDNTPQSLVAVIGNKDVHGLYDILLNYRSYLTSLAGLDVPLLYSPIPFPNAAISTPEVRCVDMKRANLVSTQGPISAAAPLGNSLDIKDSYLPPWIISNIIAALSSLGSFEASFVTEGTSVGLNVALGDCSKKSDEGAPKENLSETTVSSPLLRLGSVKSLKYSNGSYTASISPA